MINTLPAERQDLSMEPGDPPKRLIKTAVNVFDLIRLIDKLEEPTYTELTERIELANSTLYDYLNTLEYLGYITSDDGTYHLTLRFFDYGVKARDRVPVAATASKTLEQLARQSGGTVWLAVEENGKSVFIEKESGEQSIETHGHLGKHGHMHCLASGKAILANLPPERVHEIVDRHGLPAQTDQTITTTTSLFDELETIKSRGYAINEGESAEGACAVGAPIIVDDVIRGAISIPETTARMESETRRQELIDLVKNGTNEIEIRLRYDQ